MMSNAAAAKGPLAISHDPPPIPARLACGARCRARAFLRPAEVDGLFAAHSSVRASAASEGPLTSAC
jgi:hypothetical protein